MKIETIQIRLQPKEKQAFTAAAELAGMNLSTWMRDRLRAAVTKDFETCGYMSPFHNQNQNN